MNAVREKGIRLSHAHKLEPAASFGLAELVRVLKDRGWHASRGIPLSDCACEIVVGTPADQPGLHSALGAAGLDLSASSESLAIARIDGSPIRLVLAGSDARGLMYALLEAADAIRTAAPDIPPWMAVTPTSESPQIVHRSVALFLFNRELENEWYHSEGFWRGYFAMLARCRFNAFTLVFSHQTAYLAPPYPFHVEIPEHPEVRVNGLSSEERARNLQTLQLVSSLARQHGIEFWLGVWSQWAYRYGNSPIVGLGPENLKSFNAVGLRRLLEACPDIVGVQYRMNQEAGVPEEEQAEHWSEQFRVIAERGLKLDLRAKGLREETVRLAQKLCPQVMVTTKFWCEHMGLPYHQTSIQRQGWSFRRYGYADLLSNSRTYPLGYRLWSVGSQRVLLWGDPDFGRRFAQACHEGQGARFEVMAPLTNKGFQNRPGLWRILARKEDEHYTYEYERYWMFYLVFGRTGYRPDCSADVWRRELRCRFGAAWEGVEEIYRASGKILPFITATHLPSASCWGWWPEMEIGGTLERYAAVEPSDPAQFYRCDEFVADALSGEVKGKWTPFQIADHLEVLADRTERAVEETKKRIPHTNAEWRGLCVDAGVLVGLARYHAHKKRAATHLAFYRAAAEPARLPLALAEAKRALECWERIVKLTDGFYHSPLDFGMESRRHVGHWRDWLADVRSDVRWVEELIRGEDPRGLQRAPRRYPAESRKLCPTIFHEPPPSLPRGESLIIRARVIHTAPILHVRLHHRPMNQELEWRSVEMAHCANGEYEASLPPESIDRDWPFQYYLESVSADGGGALWPSWMERTPYIVLPTAAPYMER